MKILVTAEFDSADDGDRYKGMSFEQIADAIKRETDEVKGAKFISVVKSESQETGNLDNSSASPVQQLKAEILPLAQGIYPLMAANECGAIKILVDSIKAKLSAD